MKRNILSICVLVLVTVVVMGQATAPAMQELHAGARSFQEGNFKEAQQHFENARKLDPKYTYSQMLVAWAIQHQFRPGIESPENFGLARKAIAAYKDYLLIEPNSEIAFNSIAVLYGFLKEDELQRRWLLDQAERESAPKKQRAECYIVLASKAWSCSFFKVEKNALTKQCVADGMSLIARALALEPENSQAWLYKGVLLGEMAKAADSAEQMVQYQSLAAAAKRHSQQNPTETSERDKRINTGDEQLDEILNVDFSLIYLAVPVPLSSEPVQ